MAIYEHLREWMGQPVRLFVPEEEHDFASTIYRVGMIPKRGIIRRTKERPGDEVLADFLSRPDCEQSRALVLGMNSFGAAASPMLRVLCDQKEKQPKLKGLFVSDIIGDETEMSWIEPVDVSQVLVDFPGLEELRLRSSHWFQSVRHICLRSLVIESMEVGRETIDGIKNSVFPGLEHLEIWLGSAFGSDGVRLSEVEPLLEKGRFPKLRSLALRNSYYSDEIADMIARSSILEQLDSLNLAMGSLSDEGAEALLSNPVVNSLDNLDLVSDWSGLSEEMRRRLRASVKNVKLDRADVQVGEGYRYVTVME